MVHNIVLLLSVLLFSYLSLFTVANILSDELIRNTKFNMSDYCSEFQWLWDMSDSRNQGVPLLNHMCTYCLTSDPLNLVGKRIRVEYEGSNYVAQVALYHPIRNLWKIVYIRNLWKIVYLLDGCQEWVNMTKLDFTRIQVRMRATVNGSTGDIITFFHPFYRKSYLAMIISKSASNFTNTKISYINDDYTDDIPTKIWQVRHCMTCAQMDNVPTSKHMPTKCMKVDNVSADICSVRIEKSIRYCQSLVDELLSKSVLQTSVTREQSIIQTGISDDLDSSVSSNPTCASKPLTKGQKRRACRKRARENAQSQLPETVEGLDDCPPANLTRCQLKRWNRDKPIRLLRKSEQKNHKF